MARHSPVLRPLPSLREWCRGQRVIYTTPLKALSNQKLVELRERFGHDTVGLQTGDASLNMDAQVVVMTTEILRNIMYRSDAPSEGELRSCVSQDLSPSLDMAL